jgi:sulfur carrier protein
MKVKINGLIVEVGMVSTVQELVAFRSLPVQQIVIELNGNIVKREQWGETLLTGEDEVEILRFVGGG